MHAYGILDNSIKFCYFNSIKCPHYGIEIHIKYGTYSGHFYSYFHMFIPIMHSRIEYNVKINRYNIGLHF